MIQTDEDEHIIKPMETTQERETLDESVNEDSEKKKEPAVVETILTSREKTKSTEDSKELPKKVEVVLENPGDSANSVVGEEPVVYETPKSTTQTYDTTVAEVEKLDEKKPAKLVVEIEKTPETEKKIEVEKEKEEGDQMEVEKESETRAKLKDDVEKMEVDVETKVTKDEDVAEPSKTGNKDAENKTEDSEIEEKDSKEEPSGKLTVEKKADKEEGTPTTTTNKAQKQVK